MRKLIALALVSLFFVSAFGTFAQATAPKNGTRAEPDPNGVWFDPAWTEMNWFVISNERNPNNLYDYQVKVTVHYQSAMRTDFGDIRFVSHNGVDEFPYWMERKTDSVVATFWFKIPFIPGNSATSAYVYYGNPAATYTGNGSAVFTFFDDFSSIAGWTAYPASASVTSPTPGVMQLNNPGSLTRAWATPNVPANVGNFVMEMSYSIKNAAGQEGGPLFRIPGNSAEGAIRGYQPATRGRAADDMPVWRMDGMTSGAGNMPILVGTGVYVGFDVTNGWYRGVATANGNSMRWCPNYPGPSISWTDGNYASGNVGIWVYAVSDLQVDWMFTRQYANPEPIVWADQAWNQIATMTVVNVANPATLTNYQVKVVTPLLDGMRADFGDVRFTLEGSETWLPYWMERGTATTGTFWVKIPVLPANANMRIHAFYDNPAATYIGNGNNVFTFFDDFSGTTMDTSKWQGATSGFTVSGGYLQGGNTNNLIQTFMTFSNPITIETRTKANTLAPNGETTLGFYVNAGNSIGLLEHAGGAPSQYWYRNDGAWVGSYNYDFFQWHNARISIGPTNNGQLYVINDVGGTTTQAFTNAVTSESLSLGIRFDAAMYGQGYNQQWDWIFARKYANPEVTVNMNPVNDDDTPNVNEDTVNTNLNPLANDADPEGNTPLSIVFFTPAQHGYAELVGTANIRYTPNANYFGPDVIRYRVVDTWGNGDDGYIYINVVNVPDAPVANDDEYTVMGNTVNNDFDVKANDYDNDGDILTFSALSGTLNGVVYLSPSGMSLLYSPNVGFYGVDTFTYTISDGTGLTDTATVTVHVLKAPVVEEETPHTPEAKGAKSSATFDVVVVDGLLIVVLVILLIALFRRREKND